jgi:DNA-binding transcriptional MerR regulator
MHLSPQSNPGEGRARNFTDADMEVFALIVEMRGQGKQYADMHAALINGQRGSLPNDIDTAIMQQPKYVQLELKIDFLEGKLKAAESETLQDKREIDVLTRQLEAAQAEIKQLTGENSVLKYRLDANIKPPG